MAHNNYSSANKKSTMPSHSHTPSPQPEVRDPYRSLPVPGPGPSSRAMAEEGQSPPSNPLSFSPPYPTLPSPRITPNNPKGPGSRTPLPTLVPLSLYAPQKLPKAVEDGMRAGEARRRAEAEGAAAAAAATAPIPLPSTHWLIVLQPTTQWPTALAPPSLAAAAAPRPRPRPSGTVRSTVNARKRAQRFLNEPTVIGKPCNACRRKGLSCVRLSGDPKSACKRCCSSKLGCKD